MLTHVCASPAQALSATAMPAPMPVPPRTLLQERSDRSQEAAQLGGRVRVVHGRTASVRVCVTLLYKDCTWLCVCAHGRLAWRPPPLAAVVRQGVSAVGECGVDCSMVIESWRTRWWLDSVLFHSLSRASSMRKYSIQGFCGMSSAINSR
jgi:hypothetical protein